MEFSIFKEKQMMWIDDYLNSLTVMLGENSEMRSWDVIQKKNILAQCLLLCFYVKKNVLRDTKKRYPAC